ncbi:hypothetical protein KJ660_04200 [Candidatus Micrarchaeota archaeon]|nr:hypothetical protein [Candidatus Micrarchaeota archaeon]
MQERLNEFLKENSLELINKISKGYSSEVFLVQNSKGKKFALKIEKEKSPRKEMVEKEVQNLKLANSISVGPKLISFDKEKKIILIEFIEGKTFSGWLFESPPDKKILEGFLKELFSQAKKLDEVGLDHGQLAGKGKNILVRNNLPVIIDFEKASTNRRVHNLTQLDSFIHKNPNSAIAKKVKEILKA